MSDEENVKMPRRGKRPALDLEDSSSESESDRTVEINKRKKINIIVSESSSDDSSDSSVTDMRISRPTKKRPRVSSENESSNEESNDESSEESSSEESDDNIAPCILSRAQLVESADETASSYSDSEDTSSESGHSSAGSCESYNNTDEEAMVQAAIQESLAFAGMKQSEAKDETSSASKKETVVSESGGFASDSSDGQSEKCPICLISFTNQEVGSPETCDHTFCCVCIQEWAKNVNTCPVDRQVFSLVLVRKELNGKVIRKIPIVNREVRDPQESDSDPTFCEVCGRSDREDRLLLCDGCDLGYHLECLNPPMENVPIEEWFCPDCVTDQRSRMAEEIDVQDGELFDLLDDMVQFRPRTSRLLPRTRQSERVRATLRSLHQELQRTHEPALQVLYDNGNIEVGFSYWSDSD